MVNRVQGPLLDRAIHAFAKLFFATRIVSLTRDV